MCCVVLAMVQELGLVAATQQPSQYQAAIPAVVDSNIQSVTL